MVSEAALKARRERQEALANVAERKRETRRKIIAGAIVLKMAREDENTRKEVLEMIRGMPARDAKLFENYFEKNAIN